MLRHGDYSRQGGSLCWAIHEHDDSVLYHAQMTGLMLKEFKATTACADRERVSASAEDTPPIYHVIYVSSATSRFSQDMLFDLLTISRRNNECCGLTGMLLYRNGFFLQFLEGPRDEVTKLLSRLREDPRHNGVRIIRDGVLPERLFPDWSMAYKNLTGLRSSKVAGYSEGLQAHYVKSGEKDPTELLIDMFQGMLTAA